MHVEDPRFPPLLTGYGIKAPLTPFDAACQGAQTGEYGAADLLWARNTSRVEMALVLEPEVARPVALQMVPVFELAVIEAVGALMPPKTSVLLRWPLELLVNGGVAGRFRFAVSPCREESVPDWTVVDLTTLLEEGAGCHTRSDFLEVISAYALSWINAWQDGGQATFAESWVGRVEGHEDAALLAFAGGSGEPVKARVLGLDDEARLLIKVGEGDVRALAIEELLEVTRSSPRTETA